jgi:hypothetical protein
VIFPNFVVRLSQKFIDDARFANFFERYWGWVFSLYGTSSHLPFGSTPWCL